MSLPDTDYQEKDYAYFSVERHDLVSLVATDAGRVLEIGAAGGGTLAALKASGKATEVVGVELISLPKGAAHQLIDRFIVGDIEQRDLDLQPGYFDTLVCGDVLEHLRDPWGTLSYLATFLKPGGKTVISLPNIRYWRALVRILLGDFRYHESGVLDRTHLRFFCRKNMLDLVTGAGFDILETYPSFKYQQALRKDRLLSALSLGILEPFFAQQYLILARKKR